LLAHLLGTQAPSWQRWPAVHPLLQSFTQVPALQ
jgi:hypothetical protein